MTESRFYRFGRKAGVSFRRARWIWESVAGSEADAIKAEYGVGRDMASVVRAQASQGSNDELQALLDELIHALAGAVRNELDWFEVTVVDDKQPTAFALPGSFVFVA